MNSTRSLVGILVGRKEFKEDGESHTYSKIGVEKLNFGTGKLRKPFLVCCLRQLFSAVVKYGEVARQLATGDS